MEGRKHPGGFFLITVRKQEAGQCPGCPSDSRPFVTDIKGFLEDVDWLYLSICVIYRRFESVNFENIERHLS